MPSGSPIIERRAAKRLEKIPFEKHWIFNIWDAMGAWTDACRFMRNAQWEERPEVCRGFKDKK